MKKLTKTFFGDIIKKCAGHKILTILIYQIIRKERVRQNGKKKGI